MVVHTLLKPAHLLLGAALLAGCAPLEIYYRPGVEVSRLRSDTLACEVAALKAAPVANEIRQRPPVYFPPRQFCNTGTCYVRPGYWVDGGTYTVDVNRPLRGRVETSCMADKGYSPVAIKQCPQSVSDQVAEQSTSRLPALSDNSCAVRNKDGSFLIVERK
jgi:hypothetical protein